MKFARERRKRGYDWTDGTREHAVQCLADGILLSVVLEKKQWNNARMTASSWPGRLNDSKSWLREIVEEQQLLLQHQAAIEIL